MTIDKYITMLGEDEAFKQRLIDAWDNEDALNDIIKQYIENHAISMSGIDLCPTMKFYRARYDSEDWTDKSDLGQYSYIHDKEKVKLFRYNKDKEQVLYTSTKPLVAYNEIYKDDKKFYISKWSIKGNNKLKLQTTLCKGIAKGSLAFCYMNIMREKYKENYKDDLKNKFEQAIKIGDVLEADSVDGYDELNYKLSSAIASKFFLGCDALCTISKKSEGKELNVTFKKDIVDKRLRIEAVYEIEPNNGPHPLLRIGIPRNNKIEWHEWEFDIDSVYTIRNGESFCSKSPMDSITKSKIIRPFEATLTLENIIYHDLDYLYSMEYTNCINIHKVNFKIKLK